MTDLVEFADRGHSLTIDRGWREVADACLSWLGQAGTVTAARCRDHVDTMMALRAHARGGPEQLVYEQAPAPVPGPGEALVAVHAAAITFAELTWDLTWTTSDGRDRTPVIPSHEVSGTVAALGRRRTGVAAGDEVYGLIDFDRDGAAAEYVTCPPPTSRPNRGRSSTSETATLPLAALTAWQALVDYAALKPGEQVLVTGGAGGVGATPSSSRRILGARHRDRPRPARGLRPRVSARTAFIGSGRRRLPEQASGASTSSSTPSAARSSTPSYGLMRPGGRLVTLGAPPSAEQGGGPRRARHVLRRHPGRRRADPARRASRQRPAAPVVSQTFPLRDGRQAFESAPGRTRRARRC